MSNDKIIVMKVVVLYRSKSEHGTAIEQYAREFLHRTNRAIELVEQDSTEGLRLAELHDITRFPAVIATKNDGTLLNSWYADESMPLIDELSAYAIEQ